MTDAALPTTPPRPSPTRPPRLRLQIHDDPGRIDAAAWDDVLSGSPHRFADYRAGERIDHVDGLAEVLIDCVAGGASVGFMHPLAPPRARA